MRSTPSLEAARAVVREHVPTLDEDRALSGEIATMSDVIAREVMTAAVRLHLEELV